jgi:hypothetical protein
MREGCGKIADDSSFSCGSGPIDKSMNSPDANLAAALRERLAIIADQTSRQDPQRHLERLQEVSERIQALVKALPAPVDPQLAHYLSRSSYDKALHFLEQGPRGEKKGPTLRANDSLVGETEDYIDPDR